MLKVIIPKDKIKIRKQIKALEYQFKNDTNDKDRKIHEEALEQLKKMLLEN
jgi:hypothetical protein